MNYSPRPHRALTNSDTEQGILFNVRIEPEAIEQYEEQHNVTYVGGPIETIVGEPPYREPSTKKFLYIFKKNPPKSAGK
jgi:hypothetical protein